MKRSRSQVSPRMSPGANDEGFPVADGGAMNGVQTQEESAVRDVVIAGAGPAGLMLA